MLLLLTLSFACSLAADTLSWGMNVDNTRNIASNLTKHNVHLLKLDWMTMLCGPVLSNSMVVNGRIYIGDLGGCYTCMDESDGHIIFQKNVTRDYGLPSGAFIRATPTYSDSGVVLAMGGVYGHYPKSYGVYLLKVTLVDATLIWKHQVSDFFRALLTGAPTIVNNSMIIVPLSSNEETETETNHSYACCNFAGRVLGFRLSDGSNVWNTSMIPAHLVGPGKYSGAAVWSSGVPVYGEYIYVTTGNLYDAPDDVQRCLIDNPTNATCYDPSVMYDSVVEIHWPTGTPTNNFRVNELDVWNVGCAINKSLPGCPLKLSGDADFGNPVMQMIRGNKRMYVQGQKSGFLWGLDENLQKVFGHQLGTGGVSGGFQYGSSINDKGEIFGQITGNAAMNWTLLDGTVTNRGFWLKTNHKGEIQWQVRSPTNDQIKASVVTTNDIMLGATNSGLMTVLAAHDGEILWKFPSNKTTLAAPSINDKSVYWGTGPSATFTTMPLTPYPFFCFRI